MNKTEAKSRARELVSKMTAEEKASQLLYNSPAIERLGIHEYNWWNEASHGVARAGTATVFPCAIGLAASFDPALLKAIGETVATEARAKYNQNTQMKDYDIYKGLTFWTPNMNVFRDPRWGRGQETYGEDPYLIAILSEKYIDGLQGDGEYLKTAACAKHFAAHSGPESLRHSFDAVVNAHDLWETYLPAFEWTVKHTQVAGVMGAYNRLNGVPCCCSEELIKKILLGKWGFDGYIVSDCGALRDVSKGHHYTDSDVESAALALRNGCDLNCGWAYERLMDAYETDLITEDDLTSAAERLFTVRFQLGEFENIKPFTDISYRTVCCEEHEELNLRAARESMVLLKNYNHYLPIDPKTKSRIAVIGPNSMSVTVLEGNYNGYASRYVTIAEGVRQVFANAEVFVSKGSHLWYESKNEWNGFGSLHSDGVAAASNADLTILCLGLDSSIEGEEGCVSDGYSICGDKNNLYLPPTQQNLAEEICAVCEDVIVVLMSGGALDPGEKVRDHAKAIIQAWYPGALGGLAFAQLLAGEYSPCGKLPVTFYYGDCKLPDFTDYDMSNRTYRYYQGEPLYPFGYGLSYTDFSYEKFSAVRTGEKWLAKVTVRNIGKRTGKEKVQFYASYRDSRTVTPVFQLCAVYPVELTAGEEREIYVEIDGYWLQAVLADGRRVVPDGKIVLFAGGHQPDVRSTALTGTACLSLELSCASADKT